MDTPISILKKNTLKNTPGRIQVLDALIRSPDPLSAEDLFLDTHKVVDLSTIYRILKDFEKKEIIDTISLDKNKLLYEIKHGRPHHHHIICTKCQKVEDVEICDMHSLSKKILLRSQKFKSITTHALELFGTCNICSKKSLS